MLKAHSKGDTSTMMKLWMFHLTVLALAFSTISAAPVARWEGCTISRTEL